MLTREQIRAVRKIEIRTSHLVSDLFGGEYLSRFKGQGVEFAEVRPYEPGDDVRSIDWNVTARLGTPHVKRFVEERERTLLLLVDASGSTRFGSVARLKQELAAELAALFAFSAIANQDRVGLLAFTDRIELAVRPRKGVRHVLRVVRDVLGHEPAGRGTDLAGALDHLEKVTRRRAVVVVISDFLVAGLGGGAVRRALEIARLRHDVVAIALEDPREEELPAIGLVDLEDPETGERATVDTSDPSFRTRFRASRRRAAAERDQALRAAGIPAVRIRTDRPYVPELVRFFRGRR